MRYPYWFAEALVEFRKAHPIVPARAQNTHEKNSPGEVLWYSSVVLAVGLGTAALVGVILQFSGIR